MSDRNREERLQIMLNGHELQLLDDFRFSRRMPSRAAAVRELLRRGLTSEGFALSDGRMRSKDYGVSGSGNGAVWYGDLSRPEEGGAE